MDLKNIKPKALYILIGIVVVVIVVIIVFSVSKKRVENFDVLRTTTTSLTTCINDPSNTIASVQAQLNTMKSAVSAMNPAPTSDVLNNFNNAVQNVQSLINSEIAGVVCSTLCTNGTTYDPLSNLCTCSNGGHPYTNLNGNMSCSYYVTCPLMAYTPYGTCKKNFVLTSAGYGRTGGNIVDVTTRFATIFDNNGNVIVPSNTYVSSNSYLSFTGISDPSPGQAKTLWLTYIIHGYPVSAVFQDSSPIVLPSFYLVNALYGVKGTTIDVTTKFATIFDSYGNVINNSYNTGGTYGGGSTTFVGSDPVPSVSKYLWITYISFGVLNTMTFSDGSTIKISKPEVYAVTGPGWPGYMAFSFYPSVLNTLNARLATAGEVQSAQIAGAEWCSSCFTSDGTDGYTPANGGNCWPMQEPESGCGSTGVVYWTAGGPSGGANVFGIKPTSSQASSLSSTFSTYNFSISKWSVYDPSTVQLTIVADDNLWISINSNVVGSQMGWGTKVATSTIAVKPSDVITITVQNVGGAGGLLGTMVWNGITYKTGVNWPLIVSTPPATIGVVPVTPWGSGTTDSNALVSAGAQWIWIPSSASWIGFMSWSFVIPNVTKWNIYNASTIQLTLVPDDNINILINGNSIISGGYGVKTVTPTFNVTSGDVITIAVQNVGGPGGVIGTMIWDGFTYKTGVNSAIHCC